MTLAAEPTAVAVDATLPIDAARRALPGRLRAKPHVERIRVQQSSLGTGFLGVAATISAVVVLLFDIGRYAVEWPSFPAPAFAGIAWLLLAALLVTFTLLARKAGDLVAPALGYAVMGGLAVVVLLDAAAVWRPGADLGRDLTAAPATGLVLLAMVGVRSTRSIVGAAGVLTLVLSGLVLASWAGGVPPNGVETSVAMVARAVLPPVVGALIVRTFRRVVGVELERVLVQSTVSAPRFAVGMLASEELARLDLAAEQLLDDVATGRNRLPLNPASAQAAAELATELRLHLIEGRRQTWLYHAISESELLGRTVSLSDPDSLAGLLDPRQRDGLLQAVWLLLGDSPERSRRSALRLAVEVTIGPALTPADPSRPGRTMTVPIVIRTTGVPRNRVAPGTWDAVRKVGRHVDSQRGGSLCIEIDCVVERPKE